MSNKTNIDELKLQNEILKNKTEKLRLVRNIAAVASIIISLVSFLILKQDPSSGSSTNNTNVNNTQIQNNSESTIQNNQNSNEQNNNTNNEINDNQDDDDDDDSE